MMTIVEERTNTIFPTIREMTPLIGMVAIGSLAYLNSNTQEVAFGVFCGLSLGAVYATLMKNRQNQETFNEDEANVEVRRNFLNAHLVKTTTFLSLTGGSIGAVVSLAHKFI